MRMRRFIFSLMVALWLIGICTPVNATTYIVSNSTANSMAVGVDTNNGTAISTPFLTVTKAFTTCAAGDTILINTGTYAENTLSSGYMYFNRNFASTVTISTYTGNVDVTITGSSSTNDNTCIGVCTNVTWNNLIFGMRVNTNQYCIRHNGSASGLIFNNCQLQMLIGSGYHEALMGNGSSTGVVLSNITWNSPTITTSGTQGTSATVGFTYGTTGGLTSGSTLSGNSVSGIVINNPIISGVTHGMIFEGTTSVTVNGGLITAGPYGSWGANTCYGILAGNDGTTATPSTTVTVNNLYVNATALLSGVPYCHGIIFGYGCTGCSANNCLIKAGNYGIVLKNSTNNSEINNLIYAQMAGGSNGTWLKGAQSCTCTRNTIFDTSYSALINAHDPIGWINSNNTITYNRVVVEAASLAYLFDTYSTGDSGGTVSDYNVWDMRSGATCQILATSGITSLSGIQSAFSTYPITTNDSHSIFGTSANIIQWRTSTGLQLYCQYIDIYGNYWNGTAFEQYSTNNFGNYINWMVEDVTCRYSNTIPLSLPAGTYSVNVMQSAGSYPSITDACLSQQVLEWNGSGRVGINAINTITSRMQFDASNNVKCNPQTGVTVTTNNDKSGYALTSGEHNNIATDVGAGLTSQGYTTVRASKIDNVDATISSRIAASSAPSNWSAASIDSSGRVLLQPSQPSVVIPTVTNVGTTGAVTNPVTASSVTDKSGYALSSTAMTNLISSLLGTQIDTGLYLQDALFETWSAAAGPYVVTQGATTQTSVGLRADGVTTERTTVISSDTKNRPLGRSYSPGSRPSGH